MHTFVMASRRWSRAVLLWTTGLAVAFLLVMLPQALTANTDNKDFKCGSTVCGSVGITLHSDELLFGAPFQVIAGDDTSYSAQAIMTMYLMAYPEPKALANKLAWMQSVNIAESPLTVRDKQGKVLTAPFPDIPPDRYIWDAYGPWKGREDVADERPWYRRNQIGTLSLYDTPYNVANAQIAFESWLVCVVDADGADNANAAVIPLMGLSWGFEVEKKADGADPGTVAGDSIGEYWGDIFHGPLVQGGQPSKAFKDGYDKYFKITFLENNDQNCKSCRVLPEPSVFALLAVGLSSCGIYSLRRKNSNRGRHA